MQEKLVININDVVNGVVGFEFNDDFFIAKSVKIEGFKLLDDMLFKANFIKMDGIVEVIVSELRTRVEMNCRKCLTAVSTEIKINFASREYYIRKGAKYLVETDDEYEREEMKRFSVDINNPKIDLTEFIREELVLKTPLLAVCKDECQGLCPLCGKNLNKESCDCEFGEVEEESPFKDLKGIIN